MFRKSSASTQMDMFSSPEMFLGKRAMKSYSDPKGWHNIFLIRLRPRLTRVYSPSCTKWEHGSSNGTGEDTGCHVHPQD